MKKFLALAAALLAACIATPASAAPTLYATGVNTSPGGGLAALYTINPATGASTLAWQLVNPAGGVDVYGGGLAYDAATDMLFATGTDGVGLQTLYSINRFTGATAVIGHPSGANFSSGGLSIDPVTGIMYSTGINGGPNFALFTISKTNGAATLVGQFTGSFTGLYGLGFRDDGVLFGNGFSDASIVSHLFTVDKATAASTPIGIHGVFLGGQLRYSDLAFGEDGTLYSMGSIDASQTGLYSVDPSTGLATLIGNTGLQFGNAGGLVFAPIPEPASLSLLALGGGALLLRRRRQA